MMEVGLILVVLVVIGIAGAVLYQRASGPRPDAPLKDAGGPEHQRAADDDARWKADRPAGPGAEPEDPTTGDASPGATGDDRPGSRG
jgi:hypothetical protein